LRAELAGNKPGFVTGYVTGYLKARLLQNIRQRLGSSILLISNYGII
jgi:hypothetical protein